ncbi:acyl carrier protein [Streptomyces wedmorensis]
MSDIERRVSDIMLAKLRVREPSLEETDFDKSIFDLELDSLDVVELTQILERELKVQADRRTIGSLMLLEEFRSYFVLLATR